MNQSSATRASAGSDGPVRLGLMTRQTVAPRRWPRQRLVQFDVPLAPAAVQRGVCVISGYSTEIESTVRPSLSVLGSSFRRRVVGVTDFGSVISAICEP